MNKLHFLIFILQGYSVYIDINSSIDFTFFSNNHNKINFYYFSHIELVKNCGKVAYKKYENISVERIILFYFLQLLINSIY